METQNQQTKPLNNIYAWILAFMPFFFGVLPEEYTNYAIIIGGVTTIGLLVADRMALSESGCEPPSILWGGIPPACLSLEARDYYKRQQSAIYHNRCVAGLDYLHRHPTQGRGCS